VFPFQWFVGALRGWILREQEEVIAFLREENRVLRAQLRGRRPQLIDEERRRLALGWDTNWDVPHWCRWRPLPPQTRFCVGTAS
jgi:hypothetical protein